MTPSLFDVRANDLSNDGVPLIKPWKRIALDPDYAGAWVVAGDVDGDGQVEILSAKNHDVDDIHYTSSVVVHRLDGSVLWRWGDPAEGRNELHHDVACQIYDWDGDGRNQVVIVTKDAVVKLDGATGKEKHRFAIPPDASDCIVFANLSGGEWASEILLKTRYGQIWAFTREGELLWTIEQPAGYGTAHQPRPMDIDGDGRDEIMAGYALLNADGTIRWDLKATGLPLEPGHLDCVRVFEMGRTPLDCHLALTLCMGYCIAMIDGEGRGIWSVTGHHFESIDVGKVCPDVPGRQVVVDIDHREMGHSPHWVLDDQGNLLGQIITDGSRHHTLVDWHGEGVDSIVLATAAAMFDGRGRKVGVFDVPAAEIPPRKSASSETKWASRLTAPSRWGPA
ncbi:MAG: rhamnogalacturonan lyase family protein [Planctomycetota bacterium]